MKFHAYHGVLVHEKEAGNTFLVTVIMELDTKKAGTTDRLEDTLNYQSVYDAIGKEMSIPSELIEHAAHRIMDRLMQDFSQIQAISLTLSKLNPPLGGDVEKVSIELHSAR
ncbi:MAG: Dihydroneopterin aldolase [Bacteroidetes bacterium ADurb.Bin174]|nr:MAG: Dihydroneopterin aldolase [Bacteroidetes bacterium ADurb.Bin174]